MQSRSFAGIWTLGPPGGQGRTARRPAVSARRTPPPDYAPWYFRKIATAFWPPNPNPLTITVSSFAGRPTPGT